MKRSRLKPRGRRYERLNEKDAEARRQCWGRANGNCQRCLGRGIDHHHPAGRTEAVRWHEHNGIWLCRACHKFVHAYPLRAIKWMEGALPDEQFDWIMRARKGMHDVSIRD